MCDCMNFPETIDKFIDGYSFKDTEEVYTNGSELIQVFRVQQALEHYMKAERNKAIDEFANKMKWEYDNSTGVPKKEIDFAKAVIDMVAEQLKGGSDDR